MGKNRRRRSPRGHVPAAPPTVAAQPLPAGHVAELRERVSQEYVAAEENAAERYDALQAKLRRADGAIANVASGLGTSMDPAEYFRTKAGRKIDPNEANDLCRSEWGIWRFVSTFPREALRKWITLTVETEGEDDGGAVDQREARKAKEDGNGEAARQILDRLEELDAKKALTRALEWNRMYGGALLIPLTTDERSPADPMLRKGETVVDEPRRPAMGEGDPGGRQIREPFGPDADTTITADFEVLRLDVISRQKVSDPGEEVLDLYRDPIGPGYGTPLWYRINRPEQNQIHEMIHRSRVYTWRGWQPEERDRPYEFGCSVIDVVYDAWNEYIESVRTANAIMRRTSETKIGVKGWLDMVVKGNGEDARKLVSDMMVARSVLKALIYDTDHGSIDETTTNVTGAVDAIAKNRENFSGAVGLSAQRLFGLAHAGMSDNDETGAERDEAAIAEFQRDEVLPALNWLVELVAAEQKIRLRTYQVTFNPLREETATTKAERRSKEATTSQTLHGLGAIDEREIRDTLRADPDNPYQLRDDADAEEVQALLDELERLRTGGVPPDPTRPGMPPPGAGGLPADGEGADVKVGVVQAAKEIVIAVANGELPQESATKMLETLIKLDPAAAAAMVNPAAAAADEKERNKPEPPPMPPPVPPGRQPPRDPKPEDKP